VHPAVWIHMIKLSLPKAGDTLAEWRERGVSDACDLRRIFCFFA